MSKLTKHRRLSILIVLLLTMLLTACEKKAVPVQTGLDKVVMENFSRFKDKNIGIVCNHTSLDKSGNHIVDLFHENTQVMAIFAPEHGYRGDAAAGAHIEDGKDVKTGINIFSLYGKIRKPSPEMLENIDVLVYDIQDVGVRFYTYISTMTYCMEAAAGLGIEFVVLDRPNPIRGDRIEGPVLNSEYSSFVGMHEVPIRYGMTAGEYALFVNGEGLLENGLKADLSVITASGWKRSHWYDETDLEWIPPSPNIPTLETAMAYPGMCFLEGTNLSEGRGTTTPFLIFGAPWLDTEKVFREMGTLNFRGVELIPEDFTPVDIKGKAHNPKFENQLCHGFRLEITDRNAYKPIETTALIIQSVIKVHADKFEWREQWIDKLSGSGRMRQYIDNYEVERLFPEWRQESEEFAVKIQQYLRY